VFCYFIIITSRLTATKSWAGISLTAGNWFVMLDRPLLITGFIMYAKRFGVPLFGGF
jgi:hypothetical protein